MNDRTPTGTPAFDAPLTGLNFIQASAGTGKTWTLAGLVARLVIERGLDIGDILVVTFTKAATAELRARIRERLDLLLRWVEWGIAPDGPAPADDGFCSDYVLLLADPDHARRQLVAALRAYDESAVFTIHGFCQRALAERAFSGRQRFELELLDDVSGSAREIVADWWRRKVVAHDRADAGWCPAALHPWLATRVQSAWVSPAELTVKIAGLLNREDARCLGGEPPALGEALAGIARGWADLRAAWQRDGAALTDAVRACKGLSGTAYRPAWIDGWQAQIDAAIWTDTLPDADTLKAFTRFGATHLHSRLKKGAADRFEQPLCAAIDAFCASAADETDAGAAVVAWALRDAFETVCRELPQRLERAGGLGFSSLITRLRDALCDADHGESLAAALAERYPAALIDEFQDTDPTQSRIFSAIYGPRAETTLALFVGDPKQAIYAFRGADLDAYYAALQPAAQAGELVENRRSTAPLLDAFNALFGREQPFRLAQLDYPPAVAGAKVAPLLRDGEAGAPFRWLWIDDGGTTKPARQEASARAATAALAELLAEGAAARDADAASANGRTIDPDDDDAPMFGWLDAPSPTVGARIAGKPLGPGDCAVLVRTNAEGELMRRTLLAAGIGCALSARRAVFETPEAHGLLDLLRGVANPRDSVAARAALAGPWFGWNAEEVLEGRRGVEGDAAFTATPSESAPVGAAAIAPRFADGFELLSDARDIWLAQGVFAMLRGLAFAHDLAGRLGVLNDGERRLANLAHLMELCDAAARDLPGPEALADWLAARIEAPGSAGESAQLRLESDENLVQIVTIHKSKGLEYPLVVLPFLWSARKPPKAADPDKPSKPVSPVAAAGPVFFHDAEADRAPTLHFAADERATRAAWDEESEEALRLLYVAVTRARQGCIAVAGAFAGIEDSALGWLLGSADARAGLEAIRDRAPETMSIETAPDWRNVGALLAAGAAPVLMASPPPARLPPAWRYTSFTSLLHGRADVGDHAAERDEFAGAMGSGGAARRVIGGDDGLAPADADALANTPADGTPASASAALASATPADLRWRYPRGADAGVELHACFEPLDWSRPLADQRDIPWPRLPDPAPAADARGSADPRDPSVANRNADPRADFAAWIAAIAATPLLSAESAAAADSRASLTLADIAPKHTAREVEFAIPLARGTLERGLAALARHGIELPPIDFSRLGVAGGYLRGFIDLVFAHDGRWWLADYKSNWLGDRLADYEAAPLAAAMTAEGYRLQAWLYLLALHRWLGLRLPGYDPARDLGGALYLFVRGMTPVRPGTGVVRVAAPVDALLAFDRALSFGADAARSTGRPHGPDANPDGAAPSHDEETA